MNTNIYIDEFNLYYGCLENTAYKWLDLERLCKIMLPRNLINRSRYFTARVKPRPDDPEKPLRQRTYLRALQTIKNLSIHYGSYQTHATRLPLVRPIANCPKFVEVWRTDEKGSDVNLVTHLLADAYAKEYEVAVIVSNDSDLAEAIKIVRDRLGLKVGILLPISNPNRPASKKLLKTATFVRAIRESTLRQSQFPITLSDAKGTFTKPAAW